MIAFDLETTGFSPRFNTIIEIGACGAAREFRTYVRSTPRVSQKISNITGITTANLTDAPGVEEALKSFVDFTKRTLFLVGYNSHSFDLGFLFEALIKSSLSIHTVYSIDLLPIVKQKYKHLQNHKLSTVYKYLLQKPLLNAHSALADAKATMDVARVIGLDVVKKYAVPVPKLYWLHRARMDRLNKRTTFHGTICTVCGHNCSPYFVHVH